GRIRRLAFDAVGNQADRGDHLMGAALQRAQHLERMVIVARLFKDGAVEYDDGIGTEDDLAWYRARLVAGEPPRIGCGCLTRERDLLHVRGRDEQVEAEHF